MLPAALVLMLSTATAQAVDIVKGGAPTATIVIPDDAPAVVAHAAEELSRHLEAATRAKLLITKESEIVEAPGQAIYLGQTQALAKAGHESADLKKNAFLRLATPNALYLAGHDDAKWESPEDKLLAMGTLLAVYDFLDRDLGVRWLWPGEAGTYIPPLRGAERAS